ncbi:MAG TPA: hypothetical protein VGT05_04510 [Patescibacteria group bacterium]|nr:hypothetical protein [Patescibacteria group bacterium]
MKISAQQNTPITLWQKIVDLLIRLIHADSPYANFYLIARGGRNCFFFLGNRDSQELISFSWIVLPSVHSKKPISPLISIISMIEKKGGETTMTFLQELYQLLFQELRETTSTVALLYVTDVV